MKKEPCKQSIDHQQPKRCTEDRVSVFKKWANLTLAIATLLLAVSDVWYVPGL